jgi:hypothetical protein
VPAQPINRVSAPRNIVASYRLPSDNTTRIITTESGTSKAHPRRPNGIHYLDLKINLAHLYAQKGHPDSSVIVAEIQSVIQAGRINTKIHSFTIRSAPCNSPHRLKSA